MRPSLVQIVQSHLSKSPNAFQDCREATLHLIQSHRFERLFNAFPQLISEPDMSSLLNRYVDILRQVKAADVSSDNILIGGATVKPLIQKLLQDVAILACGELVQQQAIAPEIFEYLQLSDELPALQGKAFLVVSSYVGIVLMDLQVQARNYKDIYETAHYAVNNYINLHQVQWVMAVMDQGNREIELADATANKRMEFFYPKENPYETSCYLAFFGAAINASTLANAFSAQNAPNINAKKPSNSNS